MCLLVLNQNVSGQPVLSPCTTFLLALWRLQVFFGGSCCLLACLSTQDLTTGVCSIGNTVRDVYGFFVPRLSQMRQYVRML